MAKVTIDYQRLAAHLEDQTAFLESSAQAFDTGRIAEFKRMALAVRTLVHDTKSSTSLFRQMDIKTTRFIDTANPYDPNNLMNHHGLVRLALGPSDQYSAPLDARKKRKVTFHEWWSSSVFVSGRSGRLTRKDLILIAANQDGGAHVDPQIDERYLTLAQDIGWFDHNQIALPDPAAHSIRQIAFEMLATIERAQPLIQSRVSFKKMLPL